jgi:hypothetical protein
VRMCLLGSVQRAAEALAACLPCAAWAGRLSVVGSVKQASPEREIDPIMLRQRTSLPLQVSADLSKRPGGKGLRSLVKNKDS